MGPGPGEPLPRLHSVVSARFRQGSRPCRSNRIPAETGRKRHQTLLLRAGLLLSGVYGSSQTFFSRTEEVGWSLKFFTLTVCGQMTVEWAMQMNGISSRTSF